MNHTRTSKVLVKSSLGQPTRWGIPSPMRYRRIDPTGDEDGVCDVGKELAPFSDSSGDNGGGCGSKNKLEKKT